MKNGNAINLCTVTKKTTTMMMIDQLILIDLFDVGIAYLECALCNCAWLKLGFEYCDAYRTSLPVLAVPFALSPLASP